MKVIESFMPKSYQNELDDTINSPYTIQWAFFDEIAKEYDDNKTNFKSPKIINSIGLAHTFIDQGNITSPHFYLVRPVLLFLEYKLDINIKRLIRVRARKTIQNPKVSGKHYNPPHVDLPNAEPYKSFIYYVNDSDGDSVFFNERYNPNDGPPKLKDKDVTECFRYTPKKGTGILFDGHQYHSGNSPVKHLYRTIINFDFTLD